MTTNLPLRHLSIRVPWHDNGWNGAVCADPVNNASCLRLGNIHERRNGITYRHALADFLADPS